MKICPDTLVYILKKHLIFSFKIYLRNNDNYLVDQQASDENKE